MQKLKIITSNYYNVIFHSVHEEKKTQPVAPFAQLFCVRKLSIGNGDWLFLERREMIKLTLEIIILEIETKYFVL